MRYSEHLRRMLNGDQRSLARLMSVVENELPESAAILNEIEQHLGNAKVIGITGSPGVGKSTLVSALIADLRARGSTVGVIAIDPSSSISGGSILGDRIRMTDHSSDAGVFIRSASARGHVGGLSASTAAVVDLLDAFGKDVVIVETVGAGQSEIDIAELSDCRVVVLAPGMGDEIQAMKAGILEIADVLVINKADLPDASKLRSELSAMLKLRSTDVGYAEVVETVSTENTRIAELNEIVGRVCEHTRSRSRGQRKYNRTRRVVANTISRFVRDQILNSDSTRLRETLEELQRGDSSLESSVARIVNECYSLEKHPN